MQYVFALILSLLTLVLVILHVRAEYRGQMDKIALYRPLTLIVLFVIALIAPQPVSIFYKSAIILGLLLSLLADLLMLIPGTPLVVGVVAYTAVVFLYLLAFGSQTAWQIPTPWVLLLLLYGAFLIWRLVPHMGELQGPTLLFVAILGLATWQAMELGTQTREVWAWAAMVGSLALVSASSVLGFDYFVSRFRGRIVLFFGAYYVGQWLIAVSIWGRQSLPPSPF